VAGGHGRPPRRFWIETVRGSRFEVRGSKLR
jgi:hypothetical protein